MTKKSTKRSLLCSVVALVLCFTMLLGTTFAWFTDSASSTGNKIVTGDLNVEFRVWSDANTYEEVDGPLFTADTIWEPGMTKVVYLSVKNAGSLDLKYSVALQVYGVTNNLTDVMSYTITPDAKHGDVTAWGGDGLSVATGTNAIADAQNVTLKSNVEHFFALSIHMDENAGNEYMNSSITFNMQILAGQLASEMDSFGSDYDADARYPVISDMYELPENATENVVMNTGDVKVGVPAALINSLNDVTAVQLAHTTPDVNAENKTVKFDSVELLNQNGEVIDLTGNTDNITVTLPVGDAFVDGETVEVYHDDVKVATVVVENGAISYEAPHFCEIIVTVPADAYVTNADELKAAMANGGYYCLANDINFESAKSEITVPAGKKVVLNMNGKSINVIATNATGNYDLFLVKGELNLFNGTVNLSSTVNQGWNAMSTIFDITAGGAVTVDDAELNNMGGTDMAFVAHLNNWGTATLNADNTTMTSNYVAVRVFNSGNDMNNVTLTNCDIITDGACFWVHNATVADFGSADKVEAAKKLWNFTFENNELNRTTSASVVRIGMTNAVYYTGLDMTEVSVTGVSAIQNAINDGATKIALGSNIVAENASVTVPAGKNVELNLNGYNITATMAIDSTNGNTSALFVVENGATLTVNGEGSVEYTVTVDESNTNHSSCIFKNSGNLVLNGGSYNAVCKEAPSGWIVVAVVDTCLYSGSAVTTINGGEYTIGGKASNMFRNYSTGTAASTKLVINGGSFTKNADKELTYIWNQQNGANYVCVMEFNGGTYEGIVYEDYYGQTDVTVSEAAANGGLVAYSGNN